MTARVARAFFAFAVIFTLLLCHTADVTVEAFVSNDPSAAAVAVTTVTSSAAVHNRKKHPAASTTLDLNRKPLSCVRFRPSTANRNAAARMASTATALRMGLLDSVLSKFRKKDGDDDDDGDGDFVRLQEMNNQFLGPGPVVLLYQVPDAIDDEEVRDMLLDGAPTATSKGISMARIATMDSDAMTAKPKSKSRSKAKSKSKSKSELIDLSLGDALEEVIRQPETNAASASTFPVLQPLTPPQQPSQPQAQAQMMEGCPVVIFSGFSNSEMMDSYNILGEELYKETASYGRGQYLACATAVPNAMNKPLKQVLWEISSDHADALQQKQQQIDGRNDNDNGGDSDSDNDSDGDPLAP